MEDHSRLAARRSTPVVPKARSVATTTPFPPANPPQAGSMFWADNFDRSSPVLLYRVAPQWFTDRSRWRGWSFLGMGQTADSVVVGQGR